MRKASPQILVNSSWKIIAIIILRMRFLIFLAWHSCHGTYKLMNVSISVLDGIIIKVRDSASKVRRHMILVACGVTRAAQRRALAHQFVQDHAFVGHPSLKGLG